MNSFKESSLSVGNIYQGILLQKYAPPCLLVNQQEEILLANGEVEKYLSTPEIKTGSMLPDFVDINIYQELKKGMIEVIQGEESVLIEGQPLNKKHNFYIYFTPVVTKLATEKLILIEFEDIDEQTVKFGGNRHTATELQQHFEKLTSITEHDIRNLVSNFIMLLKFEDSNYTTDNKIDDVNKMQAQFLSKFHINLNNLVTKINRNFQ